MVQKTSLSEQFPPSNSGMSGTGKRTFYAMVSRNPTSGASNNGAAWFDENTRGIMNIGYPSTRNPYAKSHINQNGDSTYAYADQIWGGVYSGTNEYPGSSSTSTWVNATNANGEFGNGMIDAFSDGTLQNIYSRQISTNVKHVLNACAINSDHLNRRLVYILYDGNIRVVDRLYGGYNCGIENSRDFAVPSLDTNMYGSASYDRKRKELTIISYVGSGGSYNCFTYSNVDFDTYPDPYEALNRPEVVRVAATLSLASSWGTNDNESYYSLKPITTDNGNVYVSVFFTSDRFALYRFTRSGTAAITGTYITGQSTTTSYGRDQGDDYGQRQITSRDGTSVATFCPYYYYGAGIRCYMIDKTNNTYTSYGNTSSGAGIQCVPYGDSSWLFWSTSNGYASNYSGAQFPAQYIKQGSGGFTNQNGCYYVPYYTGPNTTNYPGFTQVTDYMLLPSHVLGAKNT